MVGKEVEAKQQIQKIKRERVGVYGWVYGEDREEKSGIRVWRKKNQEGKKKKENEDIERRRVGTCVVEKKLRGEKKIKVFGLC